jgi:hypothetical protein
MADDGKVIIELVGKDSATQTFVKSMQDMAGSVKKLEDSGKGLGSLSGVFASLQGHWTGLVASIAGGLSLGKFLSDFGKLAETESALLKMAKRLNDTVENVSALGYVAKKSGMDADAFNIALERMQKNVSNAAKGVEQATNMVDEFGEPVGKSSKALDELGLRAEVLNKLPLPQKLMEISRAMKDNVEPADQSRVALELFGKSGGGLVLALREGPEAIQKWIDRYAELGGVLTTEGAEAMSKAKAAAGDLSIAWNNFARELYEGVAPAITSTINLLTDLILAAKNAKPAVAIAAETAMQYAIDQANTPVEAPEGAETFYGPAAPENLRKPPTRQAPAKAGKSGGGGKGGGSSDAAEASLKSFIDTMNQETARAAGDTEAILNSWYGKQAGVLDKLAAKNIDVTAGKLALDAAYYSKLEKLTADFTDWYNSGLGNQYDQLVAQERKKLAEVAGDKAKEAQVIEVFDRKHFDLSQQMETDRLNLFKGYLDTMAGLSPVLADQLGYKRQALAYELRLADAALERQLREGKITRDTYDQAQALAAVAAQARKYSLEMENDKGIAGWAFERNKSVGQQSTIKSMMSGAESFLTNAFSSGLQGVLSKDKNALKDIGKTMFQGFLGEIQKGSITKSFDSLAKIMAPKGPGKEGQDDGGLGEAAGLLSGAGMQLGVSAGGLLLSGIGIMATSQALVYAGTVLQMAGLAIQLYEALTATSTTVALTGAAGALYGSAIALSSAAVALGGAGAASTGGSVLGGIAKAIPVIGGFFHSGGPIYAHGGLNLKSDEVPIIAQTGERVLSRSQNRDYEAGRSQGNGLRIGAIHIDARGAHKDIDWGHVVKRQIIPQLDKHLGKRGYQKIGGGR